MTKFFAFRSVRAVITVGLTFATVALWNVAAHAAPLVPSAKTQAALHYAPLGAAKGNPPSAARAQMARYNVPGGCVITTEIRKSDGAIIRHSRCEYTPAQRARLATTGR